MDSMDQGFDRNTWWGDQAENANKTTNETRRQHLANMRNAIDVFRGAQPSQSASSPSASADAAPPLPEGTVDARRGPRDHLQENNRVTTLQPEFF